MDLFFNNRKRKLSEEEGKVQQALHSKKEASKGVKSMARKSREVTEALNKNRRTNHYSERVRIIFSSNRKAG